MPHSVRVSGSVCLSVCAGNLEMNIPELSAYVVCLYCQGQLERGQRYRATRKDSQWVCLFSLKYLFEIIEGICDWGHVDFEVEVGL